MNVRQLLGISSALVFLLQVHVAAQQPGPPLAAAPKTPQGKMTDHGIWITDTARELTLTHRGPFVRLADGRLFCIQENKAYVSADEGKSWQQYSVLSADTSEFTIGVARDIVRTANGTIIVPFSNLARKKWTWSNELHDAPGAVLPTYVIRSTDGGKTWLEPQKLHDDWTGDNSALIQTSKGRVVLVSMKMLHDPGRHAVLTYYSDDEGDSWQASHVLDLGGVGHHDGTIEAALEELEDGRLWMLIRTNWGKFWNAYSNDGGASWRTIYPSSIDASSSPAFLRRLKSGRIVLVWNRLFPQNVVRYPFQGGKGYTAAVPASWHRDELSIALSDDDGKTWTDPVVVARKPGGNLSYPYVFEHQPGELWVIAGDGVQIALTELDFVPSPSD